MRTGLKLAALATLVAVTAPMAVPAATPVSAGPSLSSIGPLTFGPGGVLYVADRQAATIFALDLGKLSAGPTPGTTAVPDLGGKIAALLGTAPAEIAIADLAVHPTSRNSFLAVMRGQGASAQPALLRIDGAGKIELLALD